MQVFNKRILSSGSMAGNLTSDVVDISFVTGLAIQVIWSGAVAGSNSDILEIQGSCDGLNYSQVDQLPLGIDAAGSWLVNLVQPNYSSIRFVYQRATSTAGSLSVVVNAKEV